MERLTKIACFHREKFPCFSENIVPKDCEDICENAPECHFIETRECPHLRVIDRLAAYEDTGLMPEEITTEKPACVFYCNRKCNLDGDWCSEGPGCPKEMDAETAIRRLISPLNDPLTLDQLREMDGEPVWLLPIQFGVPYGYWGIVTEISDDGVRLATKENPYDFGASSLYGVTWIAYRHKLEDEQNVPNLGTEEG